MKRFEFSYRGRDNDDMHFVVVYDESLISACERVLCRKVDTSELDVTSLHKNWFIKGWSDTTFAVHEQPYEQSSHVVMPRSHQTRINPILEGLI